MIYAFTGAFIALDFITGMVKAIGTKNFSSTKMRQGLYHKVGLVLCIVLGVLIDYAQRVLDLGFSLPMATTICVYIVLMEIGSIAENILDINPELKGGKIAVLFESFKKGQDDDENS